MFRHPLLAAGALASALVTTPTPAVEAESLDLEPVTVTATRLEPSAELLPAGTLVIGREQLRQMPGDSLADALVTVAGVNGRRLYGAGDAGTSIDLLGFGAAGSLNTLVLLNGRRLNSVDLAAVDLSVVPLSAIERIEVLPASGAVLYGSGAVGGAINIVTRDSYDNETGLEVSAGNHGTGGGSLRAARRTEGQSGLAAVRYLESDGWRDNTDISQWNAFADWRRPGTDKSFSTTLLLDRQKIGLPGARRVDPGTGTDELADDPRGTGTRGDWAEQEGIQLLPGMRLSLGKDVALQLDGNLRLRRQQSYVEDYFTYTEARTGTLALNPRLLGVLGIGDSRHLWSAGLDLQGTSFTREASLDESTSGEPIHQVDIDQYAAAVYVLDTFTLGAATSLTLGARHEWVRLEAEDEYDPNAPAGPCFFPPCDGEAAPVELEQDAGIYGAGLRHWFSEPLSAFLNFERSARHASVDEIFEYKYDPVSGASSYTLEPLAVQTGRLASTGMTWRRGGQHSTLTGWRGDFDREIHFDPESFDNINLDPTRRYGVSLNSRWRLDDSLWFTLNAAWQRARFRDGGYQGNEVPLVPRQTGYVRFDWQPVAYLGLSIAHRYTGKRYMDNDQENDFGQRIDAWRSTDLELRFAGRHGVYCTVGLFNLEDEINVDYAVASTFSPGVYNAYPLPDRHLLLSLGVRL